MAPKVNMLYGGGRGSAGGGLPRYIAGGALDDPVTITLDPGGVYWLSVTSVTRATDAYSGHAAYQIAAPWGQKYGTTGADSRSMVSNGTQRLTIATNNDSTLTLTPATPATYACRFALYKVV